MEDPAGKRSEDMAGKEKKTMGWKEIKPEEWKVNPFTAIGKEWMLITAGEKENCNTMTASWGSMGVIWENHRLRYISVRAVIRRNL